MSVWKSFAFNLCYENFGNFTRKIFKAYVYELHNGIVSNNDQGCALEKNSLKRRFIRHLLNYMHIVNSMLPCFHLICINYFTKVFAILRIPENQKTPPVLPEKCHAHSNCTNFLICLFLDKTLLQ